jgi:2-hydroxychromene-2-carboxylate isomerase
VTLSARLGDARLCVALDLRHPFAYLALGPSAALGAATQVAIDWLPLTAATLKAPSVPSAADDRGIWHRRHRARAIAREIEVYGAASALVLRDYYRDGDAEAANLGWLWLRERNRAGLLPYLEDVFRRYWALELDPSKLDRVGVIVESHGGDGAAFRAWAESRGPDALASIAAELRDFGVYQSPAYVLNGEVFYGRQHLPMIRWILEGRSGPGPI